MIHYYISTMTEIVFFIVVSHLIISWLAQDKRHNMVGYFVLYVIALVVTEQCALVTMHHFLYWMLPCFSMLFILFHQEQLQKNFVSITHANLQAPLKNDRADFITTMLQIGLYNTMHQKNTFFIIEGNQDLTLLIQSAVPLNIPIQKELIESICNSSLYDEHAALWMQYTGIIKGINSTIIQTMHLKNETELQDHAVDMLCKKTDCFVISCNANGLWTFKNNHHTHKALNTNQIQKLCNQKIELLTQQRSIMYVNHKTADRQTTVS